MGNREIKFRAWNGKEMVLDALKTSFTPAQVYMGVSLPPSVSPSFVTCSAQAYMQYTGMKDANGVDLFEGDVVSVAGTGNAEVKICPAYGVVFSDKDGFERPYIDCIAEGDHPTIVGNIYQNQELLK